MLLQIQNALGKTEHLHPVEAMSFSSRLVYSAYLIPYGVSIYFKHITFLEAIVKNHMIILKLLFYNNYTKKSIAKPIIKRNNPMPNQKHTTTQNANGLFFL